MVVHPCSQIQAIFQGGMKKHQALLVMIFISDAMICAVIYALQNPTHIFIIGNFVNDASEIRSVFSNPKWCALQLIHHPPIFEGSTKLFGLWYLVMSIS